MRIKVEKDDGNAGRGQLRCEQVDRLPQLIAGHMFKSDLVAPVQIEIIEVRTFHNFNMIGLNDKPRTIFKLILRHIIQEPNRLSPAQDYTP